MKLLKKLMDKLIMIQKRINKKPKTKLRILKVSKFYEKVSHNCDYKLKAYQEQLK